MSLYKQIFGALLFLFAVLSIALLPFFHAELIAQFSLLNLCLFILVLLSFFLLGLGAGFFCCWLLNCIKASAKLNSTNESEPLPEKAQGISELLLKADRDGVFHIPEYKASFKINKNDQPIKIVLSADRL